MMTCRFVAGVLLLQLLDVYKARATGTCVLPRFTDAAFGPGLPLSASSSPDRRPSGTITLPMGQALVALQKAKQTAAAGAAGAAAAAAEGPTKVPPSAPAPAPRCALIKDQRLTAVWCVVCGVWSDSSRRTKCCALRWSWAKLRTCDASKLCTSR
jgi:hypothetical protein